MQDRIEALFDEYLEAVFARRTVDLEQFLAENPDLGDEERRRLCVLAGALNPPEPAPDLPRDFGPYRLLRLLGRGGQGVVYLAQDTRLARPVALKVLDRPDLAAFADSSPTGPTARLRREAEVASKLDHPGICVVYEMGVVGQSPYVAMRYIEGETLARKIARAREAGCRMLPAELADEDSSATRRRETLRRTVQLVEQAARALHAAHQSGVIHRDIKPANIMVTGAGQPVLLDFGLARDQASDSLALTQTGEIFGSPSYMSCEQVSPKLGALDRRTDVYSLGVVLYECLTLRRPFEHPTREGLFRAILCEDPPDPRQVNAGVDRELAVVLETALEKDRDRRYKTALDLAEDLRRWREYEPILARPASPVLRVRRWTQRNRVLATSALSIFTLLVGLLVAAQEVVKQQAAHAEVLRGAMLAANSSAVLPSDPALALRLAIEGAWRSQSLTATNALHAALARVRERRVIQAPPSTGGAIDALIASADGKYLIGASKDGLLRVWRVADWSAVATLHGPARELDELHLTRDGRWLAAKSVPDDTVFLWDTARWQGRSGVDIPQADQALRLPHESANLSRISPDGERVLTYGPPSARVWNIRASEVAPKTLARAGIHTAFWGRDGVRVALLGPNLIWNPATGETVALQGSPCAGVGDFSPDGDLLVAGIQGGGARIWNASDGSFRLSLAERGQVTRALFSPDGRTIYIGCANGQGDLFDAASGQLLSECRGPAQAISSAAFSLDGTRLSTISGDGAARVWDALTGNELAVLSCDSPVTSCCELADGQQIATGQLDGSLRLWDREDGWTRGTIDSGLPVDGFAACCFDRSGTRLALAAGNDVRIYDARSRAPLGTLRGHQGRVHKIVFTHDDRTILTAAEDSTVRKWDAATFEPTGSIESAAPASPVWCVDVSPDGQLVVTASEDNRARLIELPSGTALRDFAHDEGCGLQCAYFSPDGQFIVSTSPGDRSIRVWNVHTGQPRFAPITFPDWDNRPKVCRFSPDGRRLVAGCWDGSISIWDATDGSLIWNKRLHTGVVNDVSISTDGQRVLSASLDETMRLWDAETGAELARVREHKGHVACAVFSPDGSQILSIASDRTAHLWPSDPLSAAIERNPRPLTSAERVRYELTSSAER